jgi:hypothetical protein
MEFQYTHYKVTPDQTLEKIESYLISIQAFTDTEWNEEVKHYGEAKYVILYIDGKYEFFNHKGGVPESFIPKP